MGFPWYAFYPAKYRKRTAGLSMIQDAAYRRLMDHYYETGEPLPANADELLRICRAFDDAEKAAVLHVLERYFTKGGDSDGGWHHSTIDEEIGKRAELSQKRSEAGSKGASKTNGKTPASRSANKQQVPQQLPTHLQSQVQLSPVSSYEETGRSAAPSETPKGEKPLKPDPWREVYAFGKQLLGASAGGIITNLRKTFDDKPRKVLAKLQDAAEKRNPSEWLNAFLWQHGPPGLEGVDRAGVGFL